MKRIRKSQIVEAVAKKVGCSSKTAKAVVEATLDTIVREVLDGNTVHITGMGSWTPVSRAQRKAYNPQTMESIVVPPKKGVKFTPAAALLSMMNGERAVPPVGESAARKAPRGSLQKVKK